MACARNRPVSLKKRKIIANIEIKGNVIYLECFQKTMETSENHANILRLFFKKKTHGNQATHGSGYAKPGGCIFSLCLEI